MNGFVALFLVAGLAPGAPLKADTREARGAAVTCAAFTADGSCILSGSEDGSVKLWDAATGEIVRTWPNAHPGGVSAIAVRPDGNGFATGGKDNHIRVWGFHRVLLRSLDIREPVTALAFGPKSAHLAYGSSRGIFGIWVPGSPPRPRRGPPHKVHSVWIDPDGLHAMSGHSGS